MITREDIAAICPPPAQASKRAIWASYVDAILSPAGVALFERFEINTPNRMIGLFGCVFVPETALTVIWESGAYDADAIVRVFGARHSAKIGWSEAKSIAALPVEQRTKVLFERVYGSGNPKKARELGNTEPGDGWKHRGVGLPQATGKEAQAKYARKIGCRVEDLALPINSLHMALLEWKEKGCAAYADRGDWISIRKLINAGTTRVSESRINGLPQALRAVRTAQRVITVADFGGASQCVALADIPDISDDGPSSMLQSREARAAAGTGMTGSYSLYEGSQSAIMKAAGAGDLSAWSIVTALLAEPLVWAGIAAIGFAAFQWVKRSKRLYRYGV